MLARRMSAFSGSGTAKARAAAKAAAAAGRDIIDLTAGEILVDPPDTVRRGAVAAIESGVNRYTETVGRDDLRLEIAAKVARETGMSWEPGEIAVTAGAKQALFNAALAVLDPGDEVIVPAPYWTTFPAQLAIVGASPTFVDTRATRYVPRLADLRAAVTPSTRAIIVNTPNNPTGAVYDETLLAGIADLALSHDLWVVFDECYGAFAHRPARHVNICAVEPRLRDRTLIVNSFSKQLALTGWRLGYLAAPAPVITAAKAIQSHTTSNANVIAQHGVLEHLRHGGTEFEQALEARLARCRRRGLDVLSGLDGVVVPEAAGGFYFYLDVAGLLQDTANRGQPTADDVVARLIDDAGVATVAGTAFGDPYGLRLSYGIDPDRLNAGLARVVATLNDIRHAGLRETVTTL